MAVSENALGLLNHIFNHYGRKLYSEMIPLYNGGRIRLDYSGNREIVVEDMSPKRRWEGDVSISREKIDPNSFTLQSNPPEGAKPIAKGLREVIVAYASKINLTEDPGLKKRIEEYLSSPDEPSQAKLVDTKDSKDKTPQEKQQQGNIVTRFLGWVKAKLLSAWHIIKSLFDFTSRTTEKSSPKAKKEAKPEAAAPTRGSKRSSSVQAPIILSAMGEVLRDIDSRKGLGLQDPRTGTFNYEKLMDGLEEEMRPGESALGNGRP